MDRILVYGDSNTWGLIPGTKQMRFPRWMRWTGILQERCSDVKITEDGLCGRTAGFEDEEELGRNGAETLPCSLKKHGPLDAAVLMLGTNDCKTQFHATSEEVTEGIRRCLDELKKQIPAGKILLISPIHLGEDVWQPEKDPDFDAQSVLLCRELKEKYEKAAEEAGCLFMAASDVVTADPADDEHLNEEGHQLLAEAVEKKLRESGVL